INAVDVLCLPRRVDPKQLSERPKHELVDRVSANPRVILGWFFGNRRLVGVQPQGRLIPEPTQVLRTRNDQREGQKEQPVTSPRDHGHQNPWLIPTVRRNWSKGKKRGASSRFEPKPSTDSKAAPRSPLRRRVKP